MVRFALFCFTYFLSVTLYAQNAGFSWALQIETYAITGMKLDDSGNVFMTGAFGNTVDIDPGPGVHYITGTGSRDIFISKLDSSGHLVWVRQFGYYAGDDRPDNLRIDATGNVYVTGLYEGTIDFDPGPGVYNLTASGLTRFFLKLSKDGNFISAMNGYPIFDFTFDDVGNMYVTGAYAGSIDLDPGPSTAMFSSGGGAVPFIAKFNPSGQFLWAKTATITAPCGVGPCSGEPTSLHVDAAGNIIVTGEFTGFLDFDPGSNIVSLASIAPSNNNDFFVWKLDPVGNLLWVKSFGGADHMRRTSACLDSIGNIYTCFEYTGTLDFSMLQTSYIFTTDWLVYHLGIAKFDVNGNLTWAREIGPKVSSGIKDAMQTRGPYLYITGGFGDTVDIDPGIAIYNVATDSSTAFILKLDTSGSFVWISKIAEGTQTTAGILTLDLQNNIVTTGLFFDSTNFDPGPGTYFIEAIPYEQAFIAKYRPTYCSSLLVTPDSLRYSTCNNPDGYISIEVSNGYQPYTYSWNSSSIDTLSSLVTDTAGIYYVTIIDSLGCIRTTGYMMNSVNQTTPYDLNVNLVHTDFQPGFNTHIWLDAYNSGCGSVTGRLQLVLPPQVIYGSAYPVPDQVNGDTLAWDFTNITCETPHLTPMVNVTTNTATLLGDSLCMRVLLSRIAGETDSLNNVKEYCAVVTASYDPNDKAVYPVGDCEEGYCLPGTLHTYTVRFQNTGTADAANIYILDSLDSDLDLTTLRIAGSSHFMYTEVLPGNVVRFVFANILLPDSASNEPLSHGYVIFEIAEHPGISTNSTVINRSAIYFDFNAPIITNQVKNTIVGVIPSCTSSISPELVQSHFAIYPNPSNGYVHISHMEDGMLEISDINGRSIRKIALQPMINSEENELNLCPGFYFYRFVSRRDKSVTTGKLIIH